MVQFPGVGNGESKPAETIGTSNEVKIIFSLLSWYSIVDYPTEQHGCFIFIYEEIIFCGGQNNN